MDGGGAIDDRHATLQIFAGGWLAGSATCNRLIVRYQTDGDRLTIFAPAATMMDCPKALPDQERKRPDLLEVVESDRVGEIGALVLTAAVGDTITARRP